MQIEKWYIKRNDDNYKEINEWFSINKTLKAVKFFEKNGILNFPALEKEGLSGHHAVSSYSGIEGYTEINTEYFRNNILNKAPTSQINNSYSIF